MIKQALSFILTFVVFFVITVSFLAAIDMLPEPTQDARQGVQIDFGDLGQGSPGQNTQSAQGTELAVRVVAKDIGMDVSVLNPQSTDIEILDEALLKGAVRYPGSAMLGQDGTVLLFGHSSYLPIIHNQAYKAFNGIQNLHSGSIVSVYSEGTEYTYEVTQVRQADATEDRIALPRDGRYLTLVTCDSFGKKTDRFVVTATLVGQTSR